jgi:di/tricarboxylate transporter
MAGIENNLSKGNVLSRLALSFIMFFLRAPVASAGVLLVIVVFLLSGRWKHNAVKHPGALEPEGGTA